jgi:hypothetical protein
MKRIEQISPFLIVAGIFSVFLFGFWGHGLHNPAELEFWQALYAILRMFLLEGETNNFKQVIASFIAAMILGYGIFQIVWFYAYDWYARFKIRYFYKGHTIIMGNTGIGYRIATELLKEGEPVVAIEHRDNFDENIEKIRHLGGLIINSSKSESNDLLKAGIARAGNCLVLTDSDEKNLQTANIITWLNHKKQVIQGPLRVLINVEDWYKKSFLKDYMDMYTRTTNFDMDIFNTHQAAAQVIYDTFSPLANSEYRIAKTEDGIVTQIEASAHCIAIIGYDQTVEHFLIENIILSHSPGLKKLKILLVQQEVEVLLKKILVKMPFIYDYLDIIPIEFHDEHFLSENYFTPSLKNEWATLNAAYIFGENDAKLISIANSFRQMLYAEFGDLNKVPIVLTLPEKSKALELLNPKQLLGEGEHIALFDLLREKFNIHVIRLITDTCTKAKIIDESGVMDALSKVINYFYSIKYEFVWLLPENERAKLTQELLDEIEQAFLEVEFKTNHPLKELEDMVLGKISKKLNRMSDTLRNPFSIEARWHSLSDQKQDSNRYVARHLGVKVNFIQKMGHDHLNKSIISKYFKIFAPVEHRRWCSEKLSYKFRYGPFPEDNKTKKLLKDTLKIHDQIIPYGSLSKEMEDKDFNMFLLIPVLQKIRVILDAGHL